MRYEVVRRRVWVSVMQMKMEKKGARRAHKGRPCPGQHPASASSIHGQRPALQSKAGQGQLAEHRRYWTFFASYPLYFHEIRAYDYILMSPSPRRGAFLAGDLTCRKVR